MHLKTLRSGILSGLIAAVIYIVIAALVGSGFTAGSVFTVALIMWVITALITFVISMLLGGFKRRNKAP